MKTFYEFFAGGGMARAGLGPQWECLFANDFCLKKSASYQDNWGSHDFFCGDVADVTTTYLKGSADLAWASFPCQDLSLAGIGAGLTGKRSGTFWSFWKLITGLRQEGRAPKVVVLENVCGTLTSHGGNDFQAICDALSDAGYRFGALVMDAVHFLPQSRPRLFIIGVDADLKIDNRLCSANPHSIWHTKSVITAFQRLSEQQQADWIWWDMPLPPARQHGLADVIEQQPTGVSWHSAAETEKLLAMMSDINHHKVRSAQIANALKVGTIYKRTRPDGKGGRVQRAEVRFDNIAGCLRTPGGGSSRQLIIVVDGENIRTRLLSSREAARLMGLPDSYNIPVKYNEAYHLAGDGVAVPVVRYLSENIIEKIILAMDRTKAA